MIVFTPIDLPPIEPDDWDKFWDIWNNHCGYLQKVRMNSSTSATPVGNSQTWKGLGIYKKLGFSSTWSSPFFDIKSVFPKMYNIIDSVSTNVQYVRIVESQIPLQSHSDDNRNFWNIRAFLHRKDAYKQWYFTKPNEPSGKRTYINMPDDTNWFMYNDLNCWHGTDFDPENKKLLLQLFCTDNPSTDYLIPSVTKYKNYTIEF